jgi:hypothetical protein
MMKRIGATILAVILMFGGSAAISGALAASSQAGLQKPQALKATDLGARRHTRHPIRYARPYNPPYYPTYYDRPYYYAPAPFFPFLGLGYGPWW